MDDDDPVLSEGKVCVALPAELVGGLLDIILEVVMIRDHDGPDIAPCFAIPDDNLVLVSSAEKVPIQIYGKITGGFFQIKQRTVDAKLIQKATITIIGMHLSSGYKVSEGDD